MNRVTAAVGRSLKNATVYRSYTTYKTYCENAEPAANTALCLIHQANYLLDKQLHTLEEQFLKDGGFTERLYKIRKTNRGF